MVHSDSTGYNRKLGDLLCFGDERMACVSPASPCKPDLFSIICAFEDLHDTCFAWQVFYVDYLGVLPSFCPFFSVFLATLLYVSSQYVFSKV